jgi:hypothetical protein
MGLVIRLHSIAGFSTNYKVEFKTGATPNSVTSWQTYSNNNTSNTLNISGATIDSYYGIGNWPNQRNPQVFPNQYNNLKFWVKITDNVTGNYVIENINIHEKEYYSDCMYCCEFDRNPLGSYISGF